MVTVRRTIVLVSVALLTACAGREPQLVQVVKSDDRALSCLQITSEIESNNQKIISLSGEEGEKVAQNIAAGVAGLLIWPLWFAMDFQDAAGKEGQALASRNKYLSELYIDKECSSEGDKLSGTKVSQGGATVLEFSDAPSKIGGPVPYEGTSLNAFSREQIIMYCQEDWDKARDSSGRTIFNPCRRPDAFTS